MTDTEIGYIDYSEMNVDKNASYDSLKGRVVIITGAGPGDWAGIRALLFRTGCGPGDRRYKRRQCGKC